MGWEWRMFYQLAAASTSPSTTTATAATDLASTEDATATATVGGGAGGAAGAGVTATASSTTAAPTPAVTTIDDEWEKLGIAKAWEAGSSRCDTYWVHSDAVGIKKRAGKRLEVKLRVDVSNELEKWKKNALRSSEERPQDVAAYLGKRSVDKATTAAAFDNLTYVEVTKDQRKQEFEGVDVERAVLEVVVVHPSGVRSAPQQWLSYSVEGRKSFINKFLESPAGVVLRDSRRASHMIGGYPAFVLKVAAAAAIAVAGAAAAS